MGWGNRHHSLLRYLRRHSQSTNFSRFPTRNGPPPNPIMRWLLVVLATTAFANAYHQGHQGHHNHHHANHHHPRSGRMVPPRYPHDIPPQHLLHNSPPSTYRTLNPGPVQRTARAESHAQASHPNHQSAGPQQQQHPQLIASASNTPVLVLKKDHARPVLASAVVGPQAPHPPPQQQQQPHHEQQPAEKRSSQAEQKPLPTVIMERPQAPKDQPKKDSRSIEDEEELASEEQQQASAERRMFFNAMSAQSHAQQQVAGPQRSTKPSQKILAQESSIQQQQQHRQQQNHHEEVEHQRRAAAASYQGSLPFEYPPPQGNYVSSGPIKAPVRYQQGVGGGRPHHPQQQHHQGQGQQHFGGPPHGKPRPRPRPVPQTPGSASEELLSEEEEEEQTPDRLQELLAKSKFTCDGKKDGYYSDDTVNCEVFHYCQANTKHSWSCPETFIFHQIHLICVPPSSDNICKQSSQFHFVNEYLYRPINEKQNAANANISLKYADRYFPDSMQGAGDVVLPYHEQSEEDEDQTYQQRPQQPQQQHRPRPQAPVQGSYNPYAHAQQQSRPQTFGGSGGQSFQPSLQYHPGALKNTQSQRPHHSAYQARSGTTGPAQGPQKQKPNVFYSPDSVNIPLQSRRPVPNAFKPSPQAPKHPEYEY